MSLPRGRVASCNNRRAIGAASSVSQRLLPGQTLDSFEFEAVR
ncbi:hypothetical protein [Chelatococcus asaccharovorans]|jgi:hypothetical protein|uniref:Uncharacterized protein n=1 Tax=Chelatococcus asaccharovorans TaxID=28210 RepID=A0A2V3TTE7_9HYPH|nr:MULTISPECIES: hypothetical protein [Hyphomicrobiales]MDR7032954.1 hypothetical protein [Mesorhizobium sp. BE184]PXW51610.1 hypothetical protein C7450_11947 [Chelatococcus asaccharovorans]CAG1015418.1 hypothetical protein RHIZO_05064 [Rhizobiaceae bacterium]